MRAFCLFGFVLALCLPLYAEEKEKEKEKPEVKKLKDLDKIPTQLVGATDQHAFWVTSTIVKGTEQFRAQIFDYKCYLQNLKKDDLTEVYAYRSTSRPYHATVTPKGTVFIVDRGWAITIKPGEKPKQIVITGSVAGIYPDGILMHDTTAIKPTPVEFIPIKDEELDLKNKIEVATPDGRVVGIFDSHRGFVRHKNTFGYFAFHNDGKLERPAEGYKVNLCVFDMDTKKTKITALDTRMHESYHATAFNGEHISTYHLVFDVKTGKRLDPLEAPNDGKGLRSVFAIHNGIGYFLQDHTLYATNLLSKERPTKKLATTYTQQNPPTTEKGLIVFTDKEWKTIPFLEKWD